MPRHTDNFITPSPKRTNASLSDHALEDAILRTLLYADTFHFPLTAREIHHYLIAPCPCTCAQIETLLAQSPRLAALTTHHEPYYLRAGRETILEVRASGEAASAALWDNAIRCGGWLARLPFVRMVALTGALAVRNAAYPKDDLDYVIVTTEGRVWMARAFAILLVRLAKIRGITLCPNYVLSENAMAQTRQDIFMAHEVSQMIPIFGAGVYSRFRAENDWSGAHLPNASAPLHPETEYHPHAAWYTAKRLLEWALAGRIGDALERWEYARKSRRFAAKLETPHHSAVVDEQRVKGHFNDHGHPALRAYFARLREYGLSDDEALAMAGD